jgi:DUF4097 and DUF4098 domain-containing protein YvlB
MKRFITCAVVLAMSIMAKGVEIKQMISVFETQKDIATKMIKVDSRFCKVNVEGGMQTALNGKLEAMADHDDYNIEVTEQDGVTSIVVITPKEALSTFSGELTITVAEGVSVEIVNTTGNVNVSNVKQATVTVTTGQGKVAITDCACALNITTKNGSITAKGLKGDVRLASTRGAMTLDNIEGTLNVDGMDGAVVANFLKGSLTIATTAGTQTLSDIEGVLSLKASTGALRVSKFKGELNVKTLAATLNLFEVQAVMHINLGGKGQIVGTKGITLTGSSDFTTEEGKIQLTFMNKELAFQLTSESSKASIICRGKSKNKKLNMGEGDIVVKGHTRTGGQVYR